MKLNTGTTEITEHNLASQCREGHEAAFRQLYLQYNKAMYNICVRILNNHEEAQDVLQESFISAFKNIKQFREKASFGSWLKRIVINKCLDALKKKNPNFIALEEHPEVAAEEEAVEEPVVYSMEVIRRSIALLPDGYRIILILYLFENHSHKMIAEKLNISEGTSKSQYARARKKLSELITEKTHGG